MTDAARDTQLEGQSPKEGRPGLLLGGILLAAMLIAVSAVVMMLMAGFGPGERLKWQIQQAAVAINASYADQSYGVKPVVFTPSSGMDIEYCLSTDGSQYGIRGSTSGLLTHESMFFSSAAGGFTSDDPCSGLPVRALR